MSKDQMFAKVVLASKPTNGAPPIITMHLRYPRIIHSELMTHRVFSRNARSSRAVPVKTMLEEVRNAPFVPWHWGKNQKGMQASEECNEPIYLDGVSPLDMIENRYDPVTREKVWLANRNFAAKSAEAYMNAGYHKQIANRLLEPFMFIDVLVTSTSWANFLHLRDHQDAEPHIRDLAVLVKEAIDGTVYQTLESGQWHLPYVSDEDYHNLLWIPRDPGYAPHIGSDEGYPDRGNHEHWIPSPYADDWLKVATKLSVARCARISYAPFDGDGSIGRELERYDLLVGSDPLHASPAEHQATPDDRLIGSSAPGLRDHVHVGYANTNLAGNLGAGWIQYRKTLPGEYVADAA